MSSTAPEFDEKSDHPQSDWHKFCAACTAIQTDGGVPTMRTIQKRLKELFNSGMRTERVGLMMRRWCAENRPKPEAKKAPPPEPMLGELLSEHPRRRSLSERLLKF